MAKHVLMYSGGLDSLIAYYFLRDMYKQDVIAVYSDLEHKYGTKELLAMDRIKKLGGPEYIIDRTLNLREWEKEDATIPQRNMFLAMVGAYYGDVINIVCQKGEQNIPDRNLEFFHMAQALITHMMGEPKALSPVFGTMTKTEMVTWYLDNNYDPEILKASVSCYSPQVGKCGMCPSCFRRWVAMSLNGIEEEYNNNPWEWEGAREYLERAKNDIYIQERSEDIIEALKRKGIE